MKRERRVWTKDGLLVRRPMTEAEKRAKSLECAIVAGELAVSYIRSGHADLAKACASNAATAAFHVIGRE